MSGTEIKVGKIETKVEQISMSLSDLHTKFDGYCDKMDNKLRAEYVKKLEFRPVRNIVYGVVTLSLTAVGMAVLTLIIKQ